MFLQITLVLAILIAALLIVAATRPSLLHVQRSTGIKTPPEKIFPLIADFHRWSAWSPYETKDRAMTKAYSGAPEGKGAVYEWRGNSTVGQGRMEITDAPRPSSVTISLDFIKPFQGHNVARFILVPEGGSTNVTWTMDGPMAFIPKLINIFMSMDTMIGRDFEAGLANLKALAEK